MRNRALWCSLVVAALVVPAAARAEKTYRVHTEYADRMAAVRTVAIVTPDVKAYEIMRNDQPVFHSAWTDRSRENVSAALEKALQARGLATRRVNATPELEAALEDVRPMYRAVVSAVFQAAYGERFTAQKDRFDYTVGDLSPLLGADVDAVVLVWGHGATSSGGRRAFQLLLGNGSFALDRLIISVVARSGDVLWFDPIVSSNYDLRDPASSEGFVNGAMRNLPEVKK
jgi:hypothetical protein